MDETKYTKTTSPEGVVTFTPIKPKQASSWKDLKTITGWYVGADSYTNYSSYSETSNEDEKNLWATKEQAEASIAMSQLSQLIARANNGWIPDWTDDNQEKYCIWILSNKPRTGGMYNASGFLAFKTAKMRDEFLELHRNLIEQAKPLL